MDCWLCKRAIWSRQNACDKHFSHKKKKNWLNDVDMDWKYLVYWSIMKIIVSCSPTLYFYFTTFHMWMFYFLTPLHLFDHYSCWLTFPFKHMVNQTIISCLLYELNYPKSSWVYIMYTFNNISRPRIQKISTLTH